MPLSAATHNFMLADFAERGDTVRLLSTVTLSSAAAAGATSVTVSNTSLEVGDWISLNNDTAREAREVTAVSGSTVTFVGGLTNAYPAGSSVGWAPKDGDTLLAVGSTANITWAVPSNETLSIGASTVMDVDGGTEVGSFAVYDSGSSNQFLASFLTNNIEEFGADGEYVLTNADVTLSS